VRLMFIPVLTRRFVQSLMQFNCMRFEDAQLLTEAGVLSLGDLIKMPVTRINAICKKAPGHHFGYDVVQSLQTVPQFDIVSEDLFVLNLKAFT